jgi:hypothetical protein
MVPPGDFKGKWIFTRVTEKKPYTRQSTFPEETDVRNRLDPPQAPGSQKHTRVLSLSQNKNHCQIQLSPVREQVSEHHHFQWLGRALTDGTNNVLFVTSALPCLMVQSKKINITFSRHDFRLPDLIKQAGSWDVLVAAFAIEIVHDDWSDLETVM